MPLPCMLAVDSGASHVACGVFASIGSGKISLRQFAFRTLPTAETASGAAWSAEVANAVRAFKPTCKTRSGCALTLAGHDTLIKLVKIPAVEAAKRARIIRFEAQQAIPCPLDEVVWDGLVVAESGSGLEVMLAAVKLAMMRPLCAALHAAGSAPSRVVPSCLALRRAFAHNYPDAAGSTLLVDIGARATDLLFLGPSNRFFTRTIALGGNTVTQDIAVELKQGFSEAESLKRRMLSVPAARTVGTAEQAAVYRAVQSFAGRLHLEIARSLVHHRRQNGAEPPAGAYLTGGGSLIAELPALLTERLQLRVERYDALRNIEVSSAAQTAGASLYAPMLAGLIGLAADSANETPGGFSLLPPALRQARAFRRRQPFLLGAAALLMAGLLPPLFQNHRILSAARERSAALEAELIPQRQWQRSNAAKLARIEEIQKQLAAIQRLAAMRSGWNGLFADLQERLVEVNDVWLDRLQILPSKVSAGSELLASQAGLRLSLSGRLLDRSNPMSKVSPDSSNRVKALLAGFAGSRFITAVEKERFDNRRPGLLRFDFVLVVNPASPL